MNRRCCIARALEGGFETIYCNRGGQPNWVGKMLDEHYATPAARDALFALGNLSQVGITPAACAAYGRDHWASQGAGEVVPLLARALADLYADCDWAYRWELGVWWVAKQYDTRDGHKGHWGDWQLLGTVLADGGHLGSMQPLRNDQGWFVGALFHDNDGGSEVAPVRQSDYLPTAEAAQAALGRLAGTLFL